MLSIFSQDIVYFSLENRCLRESGADRDTRNKVKRAGLLRFCPVNNSPQVHKKRDGFVVFALRK